MFAIQMAVRIRTSRTLSHRRRDPLDDFRCEFIAPDWWRDFVPGLKQDHRGDSRDTESRRGLRRRVGIKFCQASSRARVGPLRRRKLEPSSDMGHTTEPKNQSSRNLGSRHKLCKGFLIQFDRIRRKKCLFTLSTDRFGLQSSIPVRGSRTRTGNKRQPMFSWLDSHWLAIRSDSKLATRRVDAENPRRYLPENLSLESNAKVPVWAMPTISDLLNIRTRLFFLGGDILDL